MKASWAISSASAGLPERLRAKPKIRCWCASTIRSKSWAVITSSRSTRPSSRRLQRAGGRLRLLHDLASRPGAVAAEGDHHPDEEGDLREHQRYRAEEIPARVSDRSVADGVADVDRDREHGDPVGDHQIPV